jgi:hypothetical protein
MAGPGGRVVSRGGRLSVEVRGGFELTSDPPGERWEWSCVEASLLRPWDASRGDGCPADSEAALTVPGLAEVGSSSDGAGVSALAPTGGHPLRPGL